MVHIINYRLHKPGKDYDSLYKAIQEISGTYWHNTTSSWIVETSKASEDVFKILSPHIDKDDELVVFRLQGDWWGLLKNDDVTWLKPVMERC